MAIWQHGNMASWQHGNIEIWQHDNMAIWQHDNISIHGKGDGKMGFGRRQRLTVFWGVTGTTWPWLTRSLTHFCPACSLEQLAHSFKHKSCQKLITRCSGKESLTQCRVQENWRLCRKRLQHNKSLHMDHSPLLSQLNPKETCEQIEQSGQNGQSAAADKSFKEYWAQSGLSTF